MANLADQIERYIKELLEQSRESAIEVQRQQLAALFGCVPSQINYVLTTRFATEQGYVIESRRGGGGFVRIVKLSIEEGDDLWDFLSTQLGDLISEDQAKRFISRLVDDQMLTAREGLLMQAAVQRDVLQGAYPQRDALRARLVKAMLYNLMRQDQEKESADD
ncbi:CtsR family transcriptional regulator [Heliobacillus mobilis]|uniref:Transcriptional regulator CtsR n=1 Tax=Heliobacterium mobile TaxID=28064 RepID=A0A6I3SL52_HELMO|nr:CtsR family transcriptional regulator [Heliobacterium mobile]MTV49516.1 CtsR family transcriptional regulator [Heliobacterium mobile]